MPLEDMVTDDLFLTQVENAKTNPYLVFCGPVFHIALISIPPNLGLVVYKWNLDRAKPDLERKLPANPPWILENDEDLSHVRLVDE
ncbi:hypothetical protein BHYA_0003g00260 [Botrytis hyacinthi]|uniref:Uncharacterized protein n=1 Tax=Botrytis hyacinthi TaxID=278943 RepID=A0A4Z1H6H3_9HELO|nr:hypothetical protein BHYA_0003g00260 [Botrytis hyacinthi]